MIFKKENVMPKKPAEAQGEPLTKIPKNSKRAQKYMTGADSGGGYRLRVKKIGGAIGGRQSDVGKSQMQRMYGKGRYK
jgi:hypothetical protein